MNMSTYFRAYHAALHPAQAAEKIRMIEMGVDGARGIEFAQDDGAKEARRYQRLATKCYKRIAAFIDGIEGAESKDEA